MKILIAGDYLPTECNMELFENRNIENIFDEKILNLFEEADYTVANLEGCFCNEGKTINKQGPCIKATEKSFYGYIDIGLKAVNLANNHCLDFGPNGLHSTISMLEKNGIKYFGAGENKFDAQSPLIYEYNGIRVGFLGIAEREFTISTDTTPGAYAFDELYTLDTIVAAKKNCDYLIILYHGSKEYYRYIVPYVQNRCRRFVDKGADFVICQHSHCVGCMENYSNKTIIYGQGNFCFCRLDNDYTNNGLLVLIDTEKNECSYYPVIREKYRIRSANENETKKIISEFYKRSELVKNKEFVFENYLQFASKSSEFYDNICYGRIGKLIKKIKFNRLFNFIYSSKYDVNMINILQCEAHRDIYLTALNNRNGLNK